jgi:hypothetical protein
MAARLWIFGEGNNELGSHDGYGRRHRGVIEALLQRACSTGWTCAEKREWTSIRKYRAGGARGRGSAHDDYGNVLGLVFASYEAGCEAVAFSRDFDGDSGREDAVTAALRWIATESGWMVDVIGGVAKPAVEGWILALRGVRDTDAMSRSRTLELLGSFAIDPKSTAHYVDAVDAATLGPPPTFGLDPGTESLQSWLATAHRVLTRIVHGI